MSLEGHAGASDRGAERSPPVEPSEALACRVAATRITAAGQEDGQEWVVREERFDLFVNGERLLALICLPGDLEAYIVGFLAGEGILECPYHLDLTVDREGRRIDARGPFLRSALQDFHANRTLTSGCGNGQTGTSPHQASQDLSEDSGFAIRRDTVSKLMRDLQEASTLYQTTGGAHIAALANGQGQLLVTAQDIGRHAAVDKAIGRAILSALDTSRCVLLCSGRLTSEILVKAIRARTPVLVSRAAPTDEAVRLAREHRITLVGFARGVRMNVYSNPSRVTN